MPFCRKRCDDDALLAAGEDPKAGDWLKVRRSYVRSLRCQTRAVVLLLALTESLKYGPLELVYAGKRGFAPRGENDYGITYNVAYMLSYLYICAFMIIYIPFFSWIPRLFPSSPMSPPTDPNAPARPSKMEILARFIQAFNMIWLPICTALSALFYVLVLLEAFLFVDERRTSLFQLPKNTKQAWKSRALMALGIATFVGLGYGAFHVLEMAELARVKTFEYAVIVVPVQINMGIMFAAKVQRKMEKKAAMKAARREQHVEEQGSLVVMAEDEKMALMAGQ